MFSAYCTEDLDIEELGNGERVCEREKVTAGGCGVNMAQAAVVVLVLVLDCRAGRV